MFSVKNTSGNSHRMLEEHFTSDSRHAKLEKQRELLRRKQKEKHAHQVLSLHALSENVETGKSTPRRNFTPKRKEESFICEQDHFCAFAYDGPQSHDLANPDELSQTEVQVIRLASPLQEVEQKTAADVPSDRNRPNSRHNAGPRQSSQESTDQGMTRSSTLLSTLDQDALLLSASDDENEDTFKSIVESQANTVPRFPSSTSALGYMVRQHSPSPPLLRDQTDMNTPSLVQPIGRLIDWSVDPSIEDERASQEATGSVINLLQNPQVAVTGGLSQDPPAIPQMNSLTESSQTFPALSVTKPKLSPPPLSSRQRRRSAPMQPVRPPSVVVNDSSELLMRNSFTKPKQQSFEQEQSADVPCCNQIAECDRTSRSSVNGDFMIRPSAIHHRPRPRPKKGPNRQKISTWQPLDSCSLIELEFSERCESLERLSIARPRCAQTRVVRTLFHTPESRPHPSIQLSLTARWIPASRSNHGMRTLRKRSNQLNSSTHKFHSANSAQNQDLTKPKTGGSSVHKTKTVIGKTSAGGDAFTVSPHFDPTENLEEFVLYPAPQVSFLLGFLSLCSPSIIIPYHQ
ncbi:hypothetical protein EG68_10158 [Paragonimus skrjabini miyazakii]|uniref:Uncharacterized protein n=1 Tax=Paragonimus skrjabini miyazakii TaxID=59628 RepID=A0A8S9YTH0_9TREM|nr:hypothetical protein EG68_10158 [Paragonimus skrjabini miyazakii]